MKKEVPQAADSATKDDTVRTLNTRPVGIWALILAVVAIVIIFVATMVNSGPKPEEVRRAVVSSCTSSAAQAAPANGMTWNGTPDGTPAANEVDDRPKRGAKAVWLVSGKIPAGSAPWTSGQTYYSCTVYTDKKGDVDQVRDMRIFG